MEKDHLKIASHGRKRQAKPENVFFHSPFQQDDETGFWVVLKVTTGKK